MTFVNMRWPYPMPSVYAGGDGMWHCLTPATWQAIADPGGRPALPSLSTIAKSVSATRRREAALHVWSAVLDVMLYSFAWRDPASAVSRWLEQGLVTEDRRLQVIARLIGEDVHAAAESLAAYLFLEGGHKLGAYGHYRGDPKTRLRVMETREVPARIRAVHDAIDTFTDPPTDVRHLYPWAGGGFDEMHLAGHCWAPILATATRQGAPIRGGSHEGLPVTFLTSVADGRGTGVLLTREYGGWYDALVEHGDALPILPGNRSWKIEVVCAPVGWLGTFRKSRRTGCWFSGPHALHEWGEPT